MSSILELARKGQWEQVRQTLESARQKWLRDREQEVRQGHPKNYFMTMDEYRQSEERRRKSGNLTLGELLHMRDGGGNLLHAAVRYNNTVMVDYLLQFSSMDIVQVINQVDDAGKTPLDIARSLNYTRIANKLERAGTKCKRVVKPKASPQQAKTAIGPRVVSLAVNQSEIASASANPILEAAEIVTEAMAPAKEDESTHSVNVLSDTLPNAPALADAVNIAPTFVAQDAIFDHTNETGKAPSDNHHVLEEMSQPMVVADVTSGEQKEKVESLANTKHPSPAQPRWNFFISFLAGLTIVYPLIKVCQYFWKLQQAAKAQRKYIHDRQDRVLAFTDHKALAFTYPSFSLFYEKGLEGRWGTKHTKEEVEAVPERYRAALGL